MKTAWDLFAIVKNMANNLDLSKPLSSYDVRGRRMTNGSQLFITELRKRAFWAIYTLDSYLATMLCKALTFEEQDIRIGHVAPTDDDRLVEDGVVLDSTDYFADDKPSLMYAPIVHAK
jgi:Fungal specific transcription factor domain